MKINITEKQYRTLINESGIRDIKNLAKRYDKAKIYFHQDLDGVTTAIAMKEYLEQNGIKVVDCEVIQYGTKEFAIKKPEGEGNIMPVLVDFAHGKPMFVIHTDHHDSQAGVEGDTATSFRPSRSNVETISQIISPKDIFPSDDIMLISTVDSANFAVNKITPEMVMNFLYKFDKDSSLHKNKMMMGLVVNKLLLAYKNNANFLEDLVMKSKPSLLSILNNIKKLAKDQGFASTETMVQNQEKFLQAREKEGVIQKTGNVISQFGLGSMKKGSYDRYVPFKLNPEADFLVTGLGGQVGMVQASCNPFKEERALKGINLGEIKDEILDLFRPELEKQVLSFRIIKKIAEREATPESVGFTSKDMMALYGKMPSFDPEKQTINGYDFLRANSGGHKCITNISGINFLYSGYDKPYTKDLPAEALPIAFYEGSNNFVKDIRQKLLRFRKLSEKQIEAALNQMKKEGIDVSVTPNKENQRTYSDLVREMKDAFVDILNKKIQNSTSITENKFSPNKKYNVDESEIQGKGVFASKDLKKGEVIGLLHDIIEMGNKYKFTELGKFHNHSDNPNCHNELVDGNKRFLVATRDISEGEELTTDYRLQPDLEQPIENWSINKSTKYRPEVDGYRSYSPFKDLDYIIVEGSGIDCDNIVFDLMLIGDNGKVKYCKKDSGSHFLEGANKVVEIPLRDNEDAEYLISSKDIFSEWLEEKIEKIDTDNTLVDTFFN
jgi:hypothetical protein